MRRLQAYLMVWNRAHGAQVRVMLIYDLGLGNARDLRRHICRPRTAQLLLGERVPLTIQLLAHGPLQLRPRPRRLYNVHTTVFALWTLTPS